MTIPDGFEPHFRKSDFTNPWEPIYSRTLADRVQIGILAHSAHANSRGFVHGGLITALADNAMGLSCGIGLESISGLVTVNLATDFVSTARIGQWILFDSEVIKSGRSLCFAQCLVTADGKPVARTNATFNVVGGKGVRQTKA